MDLVEKQRLENHKMWDSQVLALSTLILGLSLTVLGEFIDFGSSNYNFLLTSSWFFLWATIVMTVFNFYLSEQSSSKWKVILAIIGRHFENLNRETNKLNSELHNLEDLGKVDECIARRNSGIEELERLEEEYQAKLEPLNGSHQKWNASVGLINFLRTITFILALSFMVLFVYLNI